MGAQQELFIFKTLVFISESGQVSETFDIKLMPDIQYINVEDYVNIFRKKNAIRQFLTFQIFDFTIQGFIPLDPTKNISKTYTYTPAILLKYTVRNQELGITPTEVKSKKQRNKERTIRQVLFCVKKWRSMHTAKGRQKNKINLKDSAKVIGISKKSLDDYFCQLRFAEKYGFDFENNISKRFGILRSFVKKYKLTNSYYSQPSDRLPKKLKVFDDLQEFLQTTKQLQKYSMQLVDQQLSNQFIQDTKFLNSGEYSNELSMEIQKQVSYF